ncbi:ATP-binding protein [Eubacterium pyruvativorans]|uniref:ATP-binding protein n=1 Tax=Eubacterium pyruvativorans TaxID=155865 RepID=UPI00087F3E98|nr:ATP-binding protein [Eubacterium pyruvativorans]SDF71288.1 hypothetical protein SAMN04487889_1435 [Eubacterium pyruvativorans]
MNFIGRTEELNRLKKLYRKDGFGTALIYGRRRVGKSELIKQSIRESGENGIYYICSESQEQSNVEGLSRIVSEVFGLPKLGFRSISEVLEYIFQRSESEAFVFVLDEYPYLRNKVEGLDSVLQSFIDRYQDTSRMKFVLCGSYVEIMKSLLEQSNPLYGRIDLSINLRQMDYYESAWFYPDFCDEDKVRLYSVFGGIPYYNRMIDPNLSVRENVIELIASPDARFIDEVDNYLKTEIAKIENANEVFDALASGFVKFKDIRDQSHVSSGPALADTLKKLISMDVVVKEAPINDENNPRKAGYYISDNMSRFYFRYIYRFRSQMNVMNPEAFYAHYIESDFESQYVPNRFEMLCRQYLIRRNRAGEIDPPFLQIGKYYYDIPEQRKNGEFDVVTEDETGYIFYEAKFRSKPITEEMIRREIDQVKNTGLNCYRYGFFSRSGFEAAADPERITIGLEEMYR